jgi:S-adenosylmethionine hydrolase
MARLITLTTDFGLGSSYVAAMKGALWSAAPDATVVDLTHSIPPQNLMAAAIFLRDVLPWFPPHCIHIVVVDPGVGTDRAILLIEWRESFILAPDNGVWTLVNHHDPARVSRLEIAALARQPTSPTFHGRDVFAPAAGRLWNGQPLRCKPVSEWQILAWPTPIIAEDQVIGEIVAVDSFGNLISNIPQSLTRPNVNIWIENHLLGRPMATYAQAAPGSLIALISSSGHLEIAEVNGSAAARLQLGLGAKVTVRLA